MQAVIRHNATQIRSVFSVIHEEPKQWECRFSLKEWAAEETDSCRQFLEQYGTYIEAPSFDMSAAFWANRFSRFIAFGHWAIVHGLDMNRISNKCTVYLVPGEYAEPVYQFLIDQETLESSEADSSDTKQALAEYYAEHVTPLFLKFSETAEVRIKELWGQVYHAVPYFLHLAKVTENPEIEQALRNSWQDVLNFEEGYIFGRAKPPFAFRCMEIPNPAGEDKIYTKPTCCLAFKGSNSYCYRCPRMKKEERNARYNKLTKRQDA